MSVCMCIHSLFVPFDVGIFRISAPQSLSNVRSQVGETRAGTGTTSIMPFSRANKYNCRVSRLNFSWVVGSRRGGWGLSEWHN